MRGLFTERGQGVVFKASTPHDHGVGRGRLTRPLSSARSRRVSHALGVATVEAGNRAIAGWGSESALAPCASRVLIGRAGRPSPDPTPL